MTKLVVEEVTCAVGKSPIGEPRTAMSGSYSGRDIANGDSVGTTGVLEQTGSQRWCYEKTVGAAN